jgi:6-phospho-beta-glucosidase
VLLALVNDTGEEIIVNVVNGQTVDLLPKDAIVETRCRVGQDGAIPVGKGMSSPPADVRAMIQLNNAYEMLAVEAIAELDHQKGLWALLLNPLVPSADVARAILDCIWPE